MRSVKQIKEDQPVGARHAAVYLSLRDGAQIVERCVESPESLRFDVFFGVSDDVVRARKLLSRDSYRLKELWSENRCGVDATGIETATAFVLHDSEVREFDVQGMRFENVGNGIPAWEADAFFLAAARSCWPMVGTLVIILHITTRFRD